jgi:protein-S-isoprenylcysteine O-methyltransferase Ste14
LSEPKAVDGVAPRPSKTMPIIVAEYFRPFIEDPAGFVLVIIIWSYAAGLGIKLLRGRGTGEVSAGLVPKDPFERRIWPLWFPLLIAWVLMPGLAIKRRHPWLVISETLLADPVMSTARWSAAIVAVASFCAVIWCWVQMGRQWRVGVLPGAQTAVISLGPFRFIRHPIYAFTSLLVLCSMVIVPTLAMTIVALPHIVLMYFKSCREEQLLLRTHGEIYAAYCRRTGRFLPRIHCG